jgi:hypothetical protein
MTDTRVIEDLVDLLSNTLNYDSAFETRSLLQGKLAELLEPDEQGVVHADISWLIGLLLRIAKR